MARGSIMVSSNLAFASRPRLSRGGEGDGEPTRVALRGRRREGPEHLCPELLESAQKDTLPRLAAGCQGRSQSCGSSSAWPPPSRPPGAGGAGRRGSRVRQVGQAQAGSGGSGSRPVARVADREPAARGEELAVARVARGQHAVEHVDAARDRLDDVLRRAHPHQVARLRPRAAAGRAARARAACPAWARRPTARRSRSPGSPRLSDLARAALAQVEIHAALHDAEQPLVGSRGGRRGCGAPSASCARSPAATASRGAGYGGHSSKAIAMSAPEVHLHLASSARA